MNEEKPLQELYNELAFYTLSHSDPEFIHQYLVDAYGAQHADEHTKPIGLAFALIGLYLHVEKGYSGKEVQRAHMMLGKHKRQWPRFKLPEDRGKMSIADVLRAAPGPGRDEAIHRWCKSVWNSYGDSHPQVRALFQEYPDQQY